MRVHQQNYESKKVTQKQINLKKVEENKNRVSLFGLGSIVCTLREKEPKRPRIIINLKIAVKICSINLDSGRAVGIMSIKN